MSQIYITAGHKRRMQTQARRELKRKAFQATLAGLWALGALAVFAMIDSAWWIVQTAATVR